MAKINLLPWREELRKQRRKDFFSAMALGVLAAAGILAIIHTYYLGVIAYHERRNKMLQDEIALLDKKISDIDSIDEKKGKLLAKIDLLQKLQQSRPEVVHLFDEISKITPDGVYLTKLSQTAADMTFEGKSQSNARVSAMMRNIETSSWMNTPTLSIIKSPDKTNFEQLSDFTLRAKQGKKQSDASPKTDDGKSSSAAKSPAPQKGGH